MAAGPHNQSCQHVFTADPILISDDSSLDSVVDFIPSESQSSRTILEIITANHPSVGQRSVYNPTTTSARPRDGHSIHTGYNHHPVHSRLPPEIPRSSLAQSRGHGVRHAESRGARESGSSSSGYQWLTPPEETYPTSNRTSGKKRARIADQISELADKIISPAKRSRTSSEGVDKPSQGFVVKGKEMRAFFALLDDPVIGTFLSRDSCRKVADKFLLAMTFVYFKRAGFLPKDYTRMNFFLALYLANDMEEDENDGKYEIFPWALGPNWHAKYPGFIRRRDKLWKRLGFRAMVSRKCCEEVMSIEPGSPFWRRDRPLHHGGAIRDHMKSPDDDGYPRGPDGSPRPCTPCNLQQYDSASPDNESWYIESSSSEESPRDEDKLRRRHSGHRFDMDGLKDSLDEFSIWAHGSEE